MALELPALALALLAKAGGSVDASHKATRAQLAATCKQYGYALSPAVVAFEASYGGVVIPESPKQRKGEPSWLFGTHACLTSEAHVAPRGGKGQKLVPVVYSPNDVIYYLDQQGQGWAQDTIEDQRAARFAADGRALVTRILLHAHLFELGERVEERAGLLGEELAKALALRPIKEASGKDWRFFSDASGKVIVAEDVRAKRTLLAGAPKKRPPKASPRSNAPSELAGREVRLSSQKRETLPDAFEQLLELEELDLSINRLRTVPDSLWQAPALKRLDLSHNPLAELSPAIARAKKLRSLGLRCCALKTLPEALAEAKQLEAVHLSGCDQLDVDQALHVLARLPKLKELSLPLSRSLTTLLPLAKSGLERLQLAGNGVTVAKRLPVGLGQLKKLRSLRIEYADEVALPSAAEDVRALRLIFHHRFSDADIRKSAAAQPEKLYLAAFAETL